MNKFLFLILPFFLILQACDPGQKKESQTNTMKFRIDTLATGLQNPWSMAFLPDGSILITERPGRLRLWKDGQLISQPVEGVPKVWTHGQGGLLEVALDPDFENNRKLYLSYAKEENGNGNTALVSAKFNNNKLTEVTELFYGQNRKDESIHFGSRIVFDRDGYLYFSIGDRGVMENAQKLGNHCGKVMRIRTDGSVPEDNPFYNTSEALPEIWSYGHRNIQGMAVHPETGDIWAHEHGPKGGDEVNIIEKGVNYGWPIVSFGINYDGTVITYDTTMTDMKDPLMHWTPSIAPCGMCFVTSERYPAWEGNILAGALVGQHIHRLVLKGNKVIHSEKLLQDFARFRDVRQGPDGYIYVLTEGPGMFLCIIPKD